jgi:predicted secreted acid phosphatase
MLAAVNSLLPLRGASASDRLQRALTGSAVVVILALGMPSGLHAEQPADCPVLDEPKLPKSEEPALNIDKHKKQLREYHKDHPAGAENSAYIKDIKLDAWILRAEARRIGPTIEFYNAVRARQIAVFFFTGRRDSQREATIRNLRREGYDDWTGLITRPDDDKDATIVPFKSGWRAIIESDDKNWGYKIIANIGDQDSDLAPRGDDQHAECIFKLPNPFYVIP